MKRIMFWFLLMVSIDTLAGIGEPSSLYALAPKKKVKSSKIDKTRILLGPGLGFGAANRSFSVNISPSVAYCLNENFHFGAAVGFNYFQAAEDYTNIVTNQPAVFKHKYPAYSVGVFARYLLGNFLVLGVEPELNNTKFVNEYSYNLTTGKIVERSSRLFVGSLLVGGGYAQRFGRYAYGYLMAYYDVVQNPNARYYQTLDFRTGIMISLWQ